MNAPTDLVALSETPRVSLAVTLLVQAEARLFEVRQLIDQLPATLALQREPRDARALLHLADTLAYLSERARAAHMTRLRPETYRSTPSVPRAPAAPVTVHSTQ